MIVALLLRAAFACEVEPDAEFVVSEDPTDTIAPDPPEVGPVRITRGQDEGTSCDDIGFVSINTWSNFDDVGFRLDLASGTLPEGLELGGVPVVPSEWYVHLYWPDGATDVQEALDFTLNVVAVDRAGNESEPVEVHVTDPGSEERGCDSSGGPAGQAAALVGLLAAALRRRR